MRPSADCDEAQQLTYAAKKKVIQSCKLFQKALRAEGQAESAEVYEELAELAVSQRFEKSQVIVLQGAPADDMYLVVSGEVSVYSLRSGHGDTHRFTFQP